MREWNLQAGDPVSLTFAADARLVQTDYSDDHIWELSLGGGDPPALAIQTTFGLRARIYRLFLQFTLADETRRDPSTFTKPPNITRLYTNFISLTFSPFPNIDVQLEIWVPESKGLAGAFVVTNAGKETQRLDVDLVGQLTPNQGQRMAATELQAASALSGYTDGLAPIVFLSGGSRPGTGPYPSLAVTMDLQAGKNYQLGWTHAALKDTADSFTLARNLASRNWEAERARLDLLNTGLLDIYTGDREWDITFALAQSHALGLFSGPTSYLPYSSFVTSRQPDHGFSSRGDGSDYNHLWNGQQAFESYFLTGYLLPGATNLAKGILKNYLAVQTDDGFIDWKPGLAGQRSRLLATPVLTSLAWRIYEVCEDQSLLSEILPGLLKFIRSWFASSRDRDGDGIPEWDHPMQAGIDDHPIYSRWHSWSHGVEISSAEGPALCSFLYRECQILARMCQITGFTKEIDELVEISERLHNAVENSWDENRACYLDWDRDTHESSKGRIITQCQGAGRLMIDTHFDAPSRLLIKLLTDGETTRRPEIFIHGSSVSGLHRVEHITSESFKWHLGRGSMTSERIYGSLEQVEIRGLDDRDLVQLYVVGYDHLEQNVLLPLWAEIPNASRAQQLIEKTIHNPDRFWGAFGIAACSHPIGESEASVCRGAHISWNTLIGGSLIRYGYRNLAADLTTNLMRAVTSTLKSEGAFRRYYHADTGLGFGERNALTGLAPLELFLDTVGVRVISPQRVALTDFSPFPWPITIKYRGLTIVRQKDKSVVIFSDGQTVTVDNPAPQIISLAI